MKNRWIKFLTFTLLVLFLIVGVPLLINNAYHADTIIYITEWEAADILSYYGIIISTAIGATVAVLTMAFTISFNRRQIQRDSYLRNEKEKWGKVESTIGAALDLINPQRILSLGMENIAKNNDVNINWAIASIQKYQMDCRLATDQLFTCLSSISLLLLQVFLQQTAGILTLSGTMMKKFGLVSKKQM